MRHVKDVAHGGFAAWAKPQRLCHVWQSNHQKTPFTTKKKSRRGGNSKNKAKGFSGGASAGLPAQALGLSLHGSAPITLEIGSRFFVERSQIAFLKITP